MVLAASRIVNLHLHSLRHNTFEHILPLVIGDSSVDSVLLCPGGGHDPSKGTTRVQGPIHLTIGCSTEPRVVEVRPRGAGVQM